MIVNLFRPLLVVGVFSFGALFSSSPVFADTPKPDPKKVAADSAAGVASGVRHWGDEMSKIFKSTPDPTRRKSEIDSKNKTMKDGMLLLPCVATSDLAGGEGGVKKLVVDQMDSRNLPLDVEVHAACSDHKWLIDIKFTKFLKEAKITVTDVHAVTPADVGNEDRRAAADAIAAAATPFFKDWAKAMGPIVKDPELAKVRSGLVRVTADMKTQIRKVTCPDLVMLVRILSVDFAKIEKDMLAKDFDGYKINWTCKDGRMEASYDFDKLKRKTH